MFMFMLLLLIGIAVLSVGVWLTHRDHTTTTHHTIATQHATTTWCELLDIPSLPQGWAAVPVDTHRAHLHQSLVDKREDG